MGYIEDQVSAGKKGWDPGRALMSALNWMQALAFEIDNEHGGTVKDQYASIKAHLNTTKAAKNINPTESVGTLFKGITSVLTLDPSLNKNPPPWSYPSATVTWYYAQYWASRCVLACYGAVCGETHASVQRAFRGVQPRVPHPFNMVASHSGSETFSPCLPSYSSEVLPGGQTPLSLKFDGTRQMARAMLLGYMKGSSAYYAGELKNDLKSQHKLSDFRSNAAKAIRDSAFAKKSFNFMHCAYRARGKANYRDELFFPYGLDDKRFNGSYTEHLYNSARFSVLFALEYFRARAGTTAYNNFIGDLNQRLRWRNRYATVNYFW